MNNDQTDENDIKIISRRKNKILTIKNQEIKQKKFVREGNNYKTTQKSSSKLINELDSRNKLKLNKSKRRRSEVLRRSSFNLNSYDYLKTLLENINEVVITQKADILEAIMGCEQPNNYHVYGRMKDGQLSYILKCREFSGCCMRFCCSVDNRQFTMKIKSANQGQNNTDDEEFTNSLIKIIKDCRCPCICCIRPEMNIFLTEGNKKLGTIENGFSFCDPIFNIYDENNNKIFYITAECCQCGLLCRNNFRYMC